ncbi:MAG: septum formation initiator family protein [Hyphomicrobiales bacterium]|nr:septum formation initiator family protein [Hyphomicrobiales bacterium]
MLRLRLRAYTLPLLFYCFSGLVSGYFLWHAVNGQRGLKTGDEYSQRLGELQTTLKELQSDRENWRRKIDLVRGADMDKDVLDEEARVELGRTQKNEVVILLPDQARNAK